MKSLTWKQINKMNKMYLIIMICGYYHIVCEDRIKFFMLYHISVNHLRSDLWYIVKNSDLFTVRSK